MDGLREYMVQGTNADDEQVFWKGQAFSKEQAATMFVWLFGPPVGSTAMVYANGMMRVSYLITTQWRTG